MLRWLAILAVLFAVTQAPVPATGKAADNGTHNSDKPNQAAKDSKAPANPTPTITPQKHDSDQLTDATKENVAVINTASSPAPWRKREWVAFGANLLLVLVGIGGVGVGVCSLFLINRQVWEMTGQRRLMGGTLAAIQEQAGHMESQVEEMKAQTSVAQTSANAALISAQAAQRSAEIAVGVAIPTLVVHEFVVGTVGAASPEAFFQYPNIKITIKNYGETPALLKWWSLCFTCEELPDIPVYDGPGNGIVLEKMSVQSGDICTLPSLVSFQRRQFSLEDVKAIVAREKIFTAYGYICYGDIFGNPLRRLKFCEVVLNIYCGELICDWWGGVAPAAYFGNDLFPTPEKQEEAKAN